jgi:N-acylglucosamine 2-epimerase
MISSQVLNQWHDEYIDMVIHDIAPFWMRHSPDTKYGGYLHYLDRDGTICSTDKSIWIQARTAWFFAHIFRTLEARKEWLDLARLGIAFIQEHGYDKDGGMFIFVERDGTPLARHDDLLTEMFTICALAETATASGDKSLYEKAWELFNRVLTEYRTRRNPAAPAPVIGRHVKAHAPAMLMLFTSRTLRDATQNFSQDDSRLEECSKAFKTSAREIRDHFFRPEMGCVLETVYCDGRYLDTHEGRLVSPGHGLETGWFLLAEAIDYNDDELKNLGADIVRDSLNMGWDDEYGGILCFLDAAKCPAEPLEHDMKVWWSQAEGLAATALAAHATGDQTFLDWHKQIRHWTLSRFPDPVYGEWHGYLLRTGIVSKHLKGNMWKGPFHIPRSLLISARALDAIIKNRKQRTQNNQQ